VSTARDGGYKLTLRAESRYREGETIDAVVKVANVGFVEAPFVLSARGRLIGTWVDEVGGDRHAETDWYRSCGAFGYWERGRPIVLPFQMLGTYGVTATPESLRDFVEGSELTLPAGTWTLRAAVQLFGRECDSPGTRVKLVAEVTIVVEP
jgi:hypothetical protein